MISTYKEAKNIFIVEGEILVFLIVLYGLFNNAWLIPFIIINILVLGITIYFFRDPKRTIPQNDKFILSPADGKIVRVEQLTEHPLSNGSAQVLSIYLSFLNVHVNRVPISGKVVSIHYHKGKFFPAFHGKASKNNEQNLVSIKHPNGTVYIRQIAGAVARRIVCKLHEYDAVQKGQKFGMIKFGSRVELILPHNVNITVSEGDYVFAGETVVGEWINES